MANQGPRAASAATSAASTRPRKATRTTPSRRFTDEVNRLYGVLNNRLYKHKYLAGDQYTIADMICYPWTINWKFQGQDIEEFKYFKRWFEEMGARPRCRRAWRPAPTCRSTTPNCRPRSRRGSARCSTISAPGRSPPRGLRPHDRADAVAPPHRRSDRLLQALQDAQGLLTLAEESAGIGIWDRDVGSN
jgi:hypothetical protein